MLVRKRYSYEKNKMYEDDTMQNRPCHQDSQNLNLQTIFLDKLK